MSSPPRRPSAIAEQEIGGDRELVLLHLPAAHRPAFRALWSLDSAMGDVVARSTDPALAAIKLAWWREQLVALDTSPPPAEPHLQAVAEHLIPKGMAGADLSEIEAGWATLLDADLAPDLVADRGARIFGMGGRLLGSDAAELGDAGALWALMSVARRGVPELVEPAKARAAALAGRRFPREVRVMTGLARLAARDLDHGIPYEPEGSAGRASALLRHRWSGIVVPRG